MRIPLLLSVTAMLFIPPTLSAQSSPPGFREEFLGQFDASARKLVALAQAMPAERFNWRPGEGVASVAEAYMHIARYNYYYPADALSVAAPAGLDYDGFEREENPPKERVVEVLQRSMDHVREVANGLSSEDLARTTRLYGRDVPQWAVLLQLLAHMNEHLGQEIAYARMNGVTPPWSR